MNIGDIVRVVNTGLSYRCYKDWADYHNATGFEDHRGLHSEDPNTLYSIISKGPHNFLHEPSENPDRGNIWLYLIENKKGEQFIISGGGIQVIKENEHFKEEEFLV